MKQTGVVIAIIGLVMAIYTGFNYVTREKVADLGKLDIMANKQHYVAWPPIVGIGIILLGVIIYIYGSRKSPLNHLKER